MTNRLGYLPDIPDQRDRPLGASLRLAKALPEAATLASFLPGVLNQGASSSCVAHAVATALYAADVRERGEAKLASRLAIYHVARRQDGMQTWDEGTRIRNAIHAAIRIGVAPESVWPFHPGKVLDPMPLGVLRAGYDRRGGTYRRIFDTGAGRIAALQLAIASGFPVVFGTDVSDLFVRGSFDASLPLTAYSPSVGGHAMCAYAYDRLGVRVRNSWGPQWGERGDFVMSYEWLASSCVRDVWAIELPSG